jgi:hypothetical protein
LNHINFSFFYYNNIYSKIIFKLMQIRMHDIGLHGVRMAPQRSILEENLIQTMQKRCFGKLGRVGPDNRGDGIKNARNIPKKWRPKKAFRLKNESKCHGPFTNHFPGAGI